MADGRRAAFIQPLQTCIAADDEVGMNVANTGIIALSSLLRPNGLLSTITAVPIYGGIIVGMSLFLQGLPTADRDIDDTILQRATSKEHNASCPIPCTRCLQKSNSLSLKIEWLMRCHSNHMLSVWREIVIPVYSASGRTSGRSRLRRDHSSRSSF